MIKEYKVINKANIAEFKVFNVYGRFRCCLCKKNVFSDESYSNQGDRLVCDECFHNLGNTNEARKWINREGEQDETGR